MVKWNTEALLRPSYFDCWRKMCFSWFDILLWNGLFIHGSSNPTVSESTDDRRDMFNQDVRQKSINFGVHSRRNYGCWTAITWKEGQGGIGGWDAVGYRSLPCCLSAPLDSYLTHSCHPLSPLPLVILGIYSRPASVYNLNYLSWEMGSLHDWETGLYL